jgi:hypothetical protein
MVFPEMPMAVRNCRAIIATLCGPTDNYATLQLKLIGVGQVQMVVVYPPPLHCALFTSPSHRRMVRGRVRYVHISVGYFVRGLLYQLQMLLATQCEQQRMDVP